MPAEVIQCPRCRTICYPGLMGYPRCHKCHEQLRQCLFCRHQQGGLCQLADADRPVLLADEHLPYCAAFASRHARGDAAWWQRPLQGWQRTAGLGGLLVVIALATVLLLPGREAARPNLVGPTADARLVDGSATIDFSVVADPRRHSEVAVQVVRQHPEAYWLLVQPPPLNPTHTMDASLRFAMPRNGRLRIQLYLKPRGRRPPPERLDVMLLSASGEPLDAAVVNVR